MSPARWKLPKVVATLEACYGPPRLLPARTPFELILWENVAYLVDDDRRARAFEELRRRVGTTPDAILAAPEVTLAQIAGAGILAANQSRKLRVSAEVALREFGGDLSAALKRPFRQARKAIGRFPSIGDPGAEKILLFTQSHKVLALDSNGLRVLQRLGFAEAKKSYAASYRSAQQAAMAEAEESFEFLMRAHQLLRRHGKETCKSARPHCEACPVRRGCRYALRRQPR